jgi:hypothetical protein
MILTGEDWNPMEEVPRPNEMIQEELKMRKIKSLSVQQINSVTTGMNLKAKVEKHGKIKLELGKILSNVYDEKEFCNDGLMAAVNLAMTYCDDSIDDEMMSGGLKASYLMSGTQGSCLRRYQGNGI